MAIGNDGRKWQESQTIAEYIGCEKKDVFYKLHHRLKDGGILTACLAGDDKALARAKTLLDDAKGVKIDANGGIKLALWYVEKFSDPYEAMEALKKAFKVLDMPLRKKHGTKAKTEVDTGSDSRGKNEAHSSMD